MADIDEKEKQTFLEIQEKIIDAHARSKTVSWQWKSSMQFCQIFVVSS